MVTDERDLLRVRGVGHNLLNAAELRLLEDVGGGVEVEGHHLGAGGGDLGPVLLKLG